MNARPLRNSFDTVRSTDGSRVCPGCGGTVDLSRYGCVGDAAPVACPSCGGVFRYREFGGL